MFFDSVVYFIFLALVVAVYWHLRHRRQNLFLLTASYIFYGWWDWRFLLLMAGSTLADFYISKLIAGSEKSGKRKTLFAISLLMNFGFLGFFKYFNFFTDSFARLLPALGLHGIPIVVLKIILPPGISFYTFQAVAYITDVYKRKLPPAESLVDYALFISLFPHLIAGPIQRPGHLLPQVQQDRGLDRQSFFDGLMLILFGLFQKCVIADNCALIANAAFNGTYGRPCMVVVLLGAYAFAWQIYGDFSGYSNIARGSAQLLGFHFMVNFRQPYLATSLQDFWRRWHISLSTWLRDYLYIPLGGSRAGRVKTYANLLTTMLLGGLWHGANWTFLAWGGMHGLGLSGERMLRGKEEKSQASPRGIGLWARRIVLFHLVCLAWVFFRASSVTAAFEFLRGLQVWDWQASFGPSLVYLCAFSLPMLMLDLLLEHYKDEYLFQRFSLGVRVGVGLTVFALITMFSASDLNAFIYFQF